MRFIARTKRSLELSWNAPDENLQSRLTGYQVCYWRTLSPADKPYCTNRPIKSPYTLINLEPAVKYSVTVAAGTNAGFGTKSPEINKITNGGKHSEAMSSLSTSFQNFVFRIFAGRI